MFCFTCVTRFSCVIFEAITICFRLHALPRSSSGSIYTVHKHLQVSMQPHVYNACAHVLTAHAKKNVTDMHTYIHRYKCTLHDYQSHVKALNNKRLCSALMPETSN